MSTATERDELVTVRVQARITQQEVAEELGRIVGGPAPSWWSISQWENGHRDLPRRMTPEQYREAIERIKARRAV